VPDLAFGLPIPDDVAALAAQRLGAQPTVVGVTGMSYYDPRGWPMQDQGRYDLYVQRLTSLTAQLIREGYGVRMLVGDVWCDRRTVNDIVAALHAQGVQPAQGQFFSEPIYTVTDLLREIAQVDIVVSSRLHPIIFGLLLDKPAVSIAYNQKNDSVMRAVGLDAFRHQIDDFDPGLLYADVRRIEAQAPALRAQIHQVVTRFRGEVDEQNRTVFGDTRGGH
jgi:polysaccharide pyruvyl transferase WcaK-like protein